MNHLEGDDMPVEFESTELLRGRPVVCLRGDSPLAARAEVSTDELLTEPLIAMRSGYVMHRYVHRLLEGRSPAFAYSTDGAEMGKLMVAEGLGVTVLPEFSVVGDPLERQGAIVCRPLAGDRVRVLLMLRRRRSEAVPLAARALHDLFVHRARALRATSAEPRGEERGGAGRGGRPIPASTHKGEISAK